MARGERRAVHMWPSQTCFVSLLGFASFSTDFPIRNQLQLVTLWIRAAHAVNWMRVDGKLRGDGAGAALLREGSVWTILGHLVGLTSVRNKSETQCCHDLRRPVSCSDVHAAYCVGRACSAYSCQRASRLLPNEPQEATPSEERVRPRNTFAPFVRVRCAAK